MREEIRGGEFGKLKLVTGIKVPYTERWTLGAVN